jgi:hypothetical protein
LPDLSNLADFGSSILEHNFWRLGWAAEPNQLFGTRETRKIYAIIDSIEILVKHGAKWKPEAESVSFRDEETFGTWNRREFFGSSRF